MLIVKDPERPAHVPFLIGIGAAEGIAEGLWLVAILSLVDDAGMDVLSQRSETPA